MTMLKSFARRMMSFFVFGSGFCIAVGSLLLSFHYRRCQPSGSHHALVHHQVMD